MPDEIVDPPPPPLGHETTRVLGAAVHQDPDLAEKLIDEFLVEPKRSIAWSRGVDNAVVLMDAVATFVRCRIRDTVLVGSFAVLAFAGPLLALAWLSIAFLLAAAGVGRSDGLGAAEPPRRIGSLIVGCLTLAGPLLFAALLLIGSGMAAWSGADAVPFWQALADVSPSLPIAAGSVVVIVVVLAVDVYGLVAVLCRDFGRGSYRADSRRSLWRALGFLRFRSALQRVRAAEQLGVDAADVVVSRGWSPFPGAGFMGNPRDLVMTLEPADTDSQPVRVPLERALHQSISEAMQALSRSPALSPHHRLAHLRCREQILVPADEMVRHPNDPVLADLLPDGLGGPPAQQVDVDVARKGIDRSHEWARYYQSFAVEAWDRDLVVSCHVTLGTDRRYLYLQWTTSVLPPIPDALRVRLDDQRALLRDAHRRLPVEIVTLPASLVARWRRVTRRFRPMRVPAGYASPEQFGADRSVREIACPNSEARWFHISDARRYCLLFDRVLIEAIRHCLRENRLSLAEFDRFADAVVHNNFYGDISNSAVAAGVGNRAQNHPGGPPPAEGTA